MQINTIGILVIIVISLIAVILGYIQIRSWKKASYDKNYQKSILDEVRNTFEKQIYALNDRLIQNEERWRDVNHLLLRKEYLENAEPIETTRKIHYSEFLRANGISENELIINSRLVFVLTPFNNQFYNEFMTIKEVCTSIGFNCIRGDEQQFKGDIFHEMLRYIVQARIVIANINGRNPNVMYELGVAQALDKSVILVSKEPKDLPIDIQSQRFLIYEDSTSLVESLKKELKKLI
jgi:nucleoside 2-deoxyribosyltransferase